MIQKIKTIFLSSMLLSAVLLPALAFPQDASAQIGEQLNRGAESTDPVAVASGPDAETAVNNIIVTIVNVLSLVVGVISVIMIIIGGFKYITSSGDSNRTASAKNTILFAIVGLVVVAMAQIIVRFVIERLIGGDEATP